MLPNTLVFGSSGFFGPSLLEQYPKVVSIGRTRPPANCHNRHIPLESIDDLSVLDGIDFKNIVFLIGNSNHHQINSTSSMMGFEYNVLPLKKILYYLTKKKRKLHKFIAFTGALLYDAKKIVLPVDEHQPLNPYINEYVFSKYIAEEVTKLYTDIPVITVRLSNIYGPTRLIRPDLVPTLIQAVLSPNPATVWSTKPQRDFIYTKDAADAIIQLLATDYVGAVNLGSGVSSSIKTVVEIIEKLSGKQVQVLDTPVSGPLKFQYDITLLSSLTGWKPRYSLERGLQETFETMRSYAEVCQWWLQNTKVL